MKKQGTVQSYISFGWIFFIMLIVGGTIIIGVTAYSSTQTDIRGIESKILATKIAKCLVDNNGKINTQYLTDKNANLLADCSINEEIIKKSGLYYIKLELIKTKDWQDIKNPVIEKTLELGNKDIESQCEIRKEAEAKNFGKCTQKKIYGPDITGEEYIIKILAGSNNK